MDRLIRTGQRVGGRIMRAPLPDSLNWLYGFGFKVGVFLFLKSFLVVRFCQLSPQGFAIVGTQCAMAVMLIALGAVMQTPRVNDSARGLGLCTALYAVTTLGGAAVCVLRSLGAWEYFVTVQSNFIMDFLHGISKGAKEITMSIVFWDLDLWTALCGLLAVVTLVYCIASKPEE